MSIVTIESIWEMTPAEIDDILCHYETPEMLKNYNLWSKYIMATKIFQNTNRLDNGNMYKIMIYTELFSTCVCECWNPQDRVAGLTKAIEYFYRLIVEDPHYRWIYDKLNSINGV